MKATRRQTKRVEPLAFSEGVERMLEDLRTSLPDLIPRPHKKLSSLLNSVRVLYMGQPTESNRGRPALHTREQL